MDSEDDDPIFQEHSYGIPVKVEITEEESEPELPIIIKHEVSDLEANGIDSNDLDTTPSSLEEEEEEMDESSESSLDLSSDSEGEANVEALQQIVMLNSVFNLLDSSSSDDEFLLYLMCANLDRKVRRQRRVKRLRRGALNGH